MKPDAVWEATLGELKLQMTRGLFDTWLLGTRGLGHNDGTLVVGVKTHYAKENLESRLLPTIKRTLARVTGKPSEIEFVVLPAGAHQMMPPETGQPESSTADSIDNAKDSGVGPDDTETITIRAVYGEERAKLIQPDVGRFVPAYETRHWLPRLGPEYFAFVHMLRQAAMECPAEAADGGGSGNDERCVSIEGPDLATRMGVCNRTIKAWLNVERVAETKEYRIKPTKQVTRNGKRVTITDPCRVALAEFIVRVTFNSAKQRVVHIRMDTPLTPEDRVRLEDMVRARMTGADALSPSEEIHSMVNSLDLSVTDGRRVRGLVRPIADRIAEFFDDEHSTRMYRKVLRTLYKEKRLDLFLEAMEEALPDMCPGGNPGASFVIALLELAETEGVDVGITPNGKESSE